MALVLENLALVAFGPDPQRVRSPLTAATVWLGPIFVDVARLVDLRAGAGAHAGALVLPRSAPTSAGGSAPPPTTPTARWSSAPTSRRVYAVAFGIGAACVGAAGALVSPILPFQPAGGLTLSVASFNIVIIGGMGSLLGAFVGGLLVSLAESLGAVFLAPRMKELVSFSLLIVILLFRPAGLFGKRGA